QFAMPAKIMKSTNNNILNKTLVHILLIVVMGFLAYSNTFHAPMQWDEDIFLRENPIIKNLNYFIWPSSAKGLPFYDGFINRYVGYLTFAINYKLHGFDVTGYHIVNLFIHLINAVLVYLFILVTFRTPYLRDSPLSGKSKAIAFTASLLFVLHPIQTEAVTYIFQRFASLAALFCLLSIVLYAYSRMSVNTKLRYTSYALSIASVILSMKTKENSFTLPIIIALYEFCFFSPTPRVSASPYRRVSLSPRLLYLAPILLTLCIIPMTVIDTGAPLRQLVYGLATAGVGYTDMPRWPYLFTQFRVIITYIRLLILPVNQNLIYDYPLCKSFFDPQVFLSFLSLAALLGLGVYLVTSDAEKSLLLCFAVSPRLPISASPFLRLIGFGILWFFIALSVESSIIPLPTLIDEYRIYLPSVGFFVALCASLFMLAGRIRLARERRMMLQLVGLIIAVLFGLTYVRNSVWSDKIVFWKDVVEKSPKSAQAYNNLGNAYLNVHQPDKANEMFDRAISLLPDYVLAYHNRAEAFLQKKEYDKAIKAFTMANAIQKNSRTYAGLGHAYYEKGEYSLAINNLYKALLINPLSETALYGIAVCYAGTGKYDKAMQLFDKILHDDPYNSDVYRNRGELHLSHKEFLKAIADLTAAVTINPQDITARYTVAIAYHYSGQYDSAIREYSRAIALNDKSPVLYDGRGLSFYYKKDYSRAIEDFTKAIELNPKYPQTYSSRGLAWAELKEFDRAIADFNKALSLDHNLATAYTNRGTFYIKTGERAKAFKDFERGCSLKDPDACASLDKLN
ncbi:MAG: tetratricopeptide repeat protein, partial [Dissulfurispiraceae bacterium]